MSRRSKKAHTLGEHAIFGDEEAAKLRADLDELRASLADLTDRVHSQFTTIAAHAEIARTQAEHARAEARADLERTRDTVIGLIEQVRAESSTGLPSAARRRPDRDRGRVRQSQQHEPGQHHGADP